MPEYQRTLVPQDVLEDLLVAINDTTWEIIDGHHTRLKTDLYRSCSCGWSSTDLDKGHIELQRHKVGTLIEALQHEVNTYLSS